MKLKFGLTFLASLLLNGCFDPSYPPTLMNEFGSDIKLAVKYSDGSTANIVWHECAGARVGKPSADIQEITFLKDEKVIRVLSSADVMRMLMADKENRLAIWKLRKDDLILDVAPDAGTCSDVSGKATG